MRDRSLQAVLRLRRIASDEARRLVTEAVSREDAARETADDAEREIVRETALACSLEVDDTAVETFSAWLAEARLRAEAARKAADRAAAETTRARAALRLARAGLEATEALVAVRSAEQGAVEAQREQHDLDDLTRDRKERRV